MSIKYYHLAKDETPPDEFCVVRDVGGEPSEYVFYVPESDVAKLRELLQRSITTHDKMCTQRGHCFGCMFFGDFVCEPIRVSKEAEKLGIEVGE